MPARTFAPLLAVATILALAPPATPATAAGNDADELIDLDFAGGTVAQYVDAIRQKGADVNIVLMPEASTMKVPAVRLRSVDTFSALRILHETEQTDAASVRELYVESFRPPVKEGRTIITVGAQVQSFRAPVPPSRSLVIGIADIVEGGVSPEAVLTAVETALELLGDEYPPAKIRYHEDTRLLIARGHPAQMDAIAEVVGEVTGTTRSRRKKADAAETLETLQVQVANLAAQLADEHDQREAVLQHMAQVEARMEVLQIEAARLRDALSERERQVVELNARIAHMRETLEGRKAQ